MALHAVSVGISALGLVSGAGTFALAWTAVGFQMGNYPLGVFPPA